MSRINYGKFLAWNALGGTLWATAFVVLGYLAGSQYKSIERYANDIGIGLLILIAAWLTGRRLLKRNPGTDASTNT
jgi:membrane-associated protein